jgi:hypothetical protein
MNTIKAGHVMKKTSATTITAAITRAEDSDMPETVNYLPAIRDGTMQEMSPRAAVPLNLYKSVEELLRETENFSGCKEKVQSFKKKHLRDSLNIKAALRLTKTKNETLSLQEQSQSVRDIV